MARLASVQIPAITRAVRSYLLILSATLMLLAGALIAQAPAHSAAAAQPASNAVLRSLVRSYAQPSWWHTRHLAHLAHMAQLAGNSVMLASNSASHGYSDGKIWGISYGYPNYCGDGDGDGWDVPCPQSQHSTAPAPAAHAVTTRTSTSSSAYTGGSGFQQCVIQRESGGNPAAVNPTSGAGGLYGFLPSTWASLGYSGLPENASVAEQNAAFAKEYALTGTSAWAPYDGC
jgi:resuscitation-promoting factor RpfC